MITIIKKITTIALALLVAVGTFAPFASVFAAAFNNDTRDYATLQVSNYTRNPGSNLHWSNAVSANAGEIVSFLVYYHNTATDVAGNTRVRVQLPTGAFTSQSIIGDVTASNATQVSGTASVTLTSNQTLTFIPGSVSWYPNRSTVAQPLPGGQNGSEIISANGLLLGDIAGGWASQGYVVFRAQVSSGVVQTYPTTPQVQVRSPYVTTRSATAITRTYALLRGSVSANGAPTIAWFEWGTAPALGYKTDLQSIGHSAVSAPISAGLSNLKPGTMYYYRAAAQNSYGTTYGNVLSFMTSYPAATYVDSPVTVRRTTTVQSVTTVAGANEAILLDPSIDVARPNAGDTIEYTIRYSNTSGAPLQSALLTVLIPEELSFVESTIDPTRRTSEGMEFDLGTIPTGDSGSISISFTLDEQAKTDAALSVNAILDYTNSRGDAQVASAVLTFLVNKGTAGLASLSSVFSALFGNWFVDLILGLLIGFGIYHFFVRQKEEVLIK